LILSTRFEQALTYAAILHSGDEAIAALLHDAVEDAGGKPRLADIRNRFGERVATIVDGCTDTDVTPKPLWKERKCKYIEHLRQEQNPSVLLVSASDKLANMRSILGDYHRIGEALWGRFNGEREGTLWYYRTMADVLLEKMPASCLALAQELDRTVSGLEALAARAEPAPAAVLQPCN
jgi:(p)ppGpp synthase/HD superfamily hydrolase